MSQIVRDDILAVVAGLGCLFVVPGPGETLQPVSSLCTSHYPSFAIFANSLFEIVPGSKSG
jgi:hypothetical protein